MTLGAIEDFALERYFARWEFAVRHQLSASDVEPWRLSDLLALADDDARRRWDGLTLGYTESTGLPALRAAIADLYDRVAPEQVMVVAGAEEGIFLAMHALLAAGDDVVVVTPAYQSLHAIPRAIGARVIEVPLREENDWRFDVDDLARAVTPRTRVIVVNFPHNPTGSHIDPETQRGIVQIAEDAGAVLLSDEVYRGLEYDAADRLPAAADLSTRAASLGVMSKTFALAGLRIGWLASRNAALLQGVARLKDYTTICSSAPSEILALIALRAHERVIRRSSDIVAGNLSRAREFMRGHGTCVRWVPPRAGSVAFPRLLQGDAERLSATLAQRHSTLLLPGTVFQSPAEYFRLGLGRADFAEALAALGQACELIQ